VAAAHLRQRLQQRVAIARRGGQPEAPQDRRIAVAEVEVDDAAVGIAQRPQDADRLREAVEQRTEALSALRAEQRFELRVVSPGFWLYRYGTRSYARSVSSS
jgi:hypothetical protein